MSLEGLIRQPSNVVYMSLVLDENGGVRAEQAPGEIYGSKERARVAQLPERWRERADRNLRWAQYVDEVYQSFMRSEEGTAYVRHLRRNGNGKPMPGSLDRIIVTNEGEGLVAATLPTALEGYLIINADYVGKFCASMAERSGLSEREVLETVIAHELNHRYQQSPDDLSRGEKTIEFRNDMSLIEFYVGLANRTPEAASGSRYLAKAEVLSHRYRGRMRRKMDAYIRAHAEAKQAA